MDKKYNLENKINLLHSNIAKYKRVLIAYSGGVDSTLLLKLTVDILGTDSVIAATAVSPTYTKHELEISKKITNIFGIKHIIFKTYEFNNKNFTNNTKLRCYYCKKELFNRLKKMQKENKCDVIMDGANYDDTDDFRPGTKAEQEHNIVTPLKNLFFTKKDIREYSKKLGLETFDYPSLACLASRIPYNEKITEEKIKQINIGEDFLKQFGLKNIRLRTSNETARIEVDKDKLDIVLKNKDKIIKKLKSIGYNYITLDLEGFRSGSMNEIL